MTTKLLTAILLIAALTAAASAAERLYRYRNSDGVLVIDFQIPARYVDQGYDIISPGGTLIEHVPPRQEEQAAKLAQAVGQEEARKKEDTYILRSFSSVDDVEAARKRRLSGLDYEMTALRSRHAQYEERLLALAEKAAGYQAAGKPVPETVTDEIRAIEEQQRNTEALLVERSAQYRDTEARYDHYRQRLVELKGATAAPAGAESRSSAPATGPATMP